ncbi:MAG: tetratricopeptide repeat protein [Kiritimatiellae bacterium]|nr:tetratricopeptide repeat protein [Kiritimatiellia bacterium]
MKARRFQIASMTVVTLLLAAGAWAQDPAMDGFGEMEQEGVQRKRAGFWRRPEKETPAEQLTHAQALEAEGNERKAARHYRALVHEWHDTPEAVKAQRAYAEILEDLGKYDAAFNEFQYLVDFYAGAFDYGDVLDHQFRIANEIMNRRYGGLLFLPGFKSPERALPLFEQIAENAPTWGRGPEVQFYIGWIQEDDKQYEGAIRAYDTLRQRWPRHELAVTAAFGGTRCLVRLADKSKRDEVTCQRALEGLAGFIRDYPDDPNVEQVTAERERLSSRLCTMHYDRAAYYDRIAKRPESALIAYGDFLRRFPYAEQAEEVSVRVRELEALTASVEESK